MASLIIRSSCDSISRTVRSASSSAMMSAKDERPFVGADADGSVGLELLEDDADAGAGAPPQGFDMVRAADFGSTGGTPPASPLGGPAPVPLCT